MSRVSFTTVLSVLSVMTVVLGEAGNGSAAATSTAPTRAAGPSGLCLRHRLARCGGIFVLSSFAAGCSCTRF